MSKFWKYTTFWDKVIKSLALFGTPVGISAGYFQANPTYLFIGGICAFVSAALAIWMVDENNDGLVDIFQDKNKM